MGAFLLASHISRAFLTNGDYGMTSQTFPIELYY